MNFLKLLDIAITILLLVMFINSIFNFSKHATPSKQKIFLTILFIITAITLSYVFFVNNEFSTYLLIGLALLFLLSNLLLIKLDKKTNLEKR